MTAAVESLEQFSKIFNALNDPNRMSIVVQAALADELACTTLESTLPVSKSTISYHVKVLRNAGLLTVRKENRFYHYRLRRDILDAYVPTFLEKVMAAGPEQIVKHLSS